MPSLASYKSWTAGDIVAGVVVAATSIPQYVAYAELAGLSGHKGLSTSGPPVMAFAFLTGSPALCIGVTSITSLMAHSVLSGSEYKDAHGEDRWADLLGTFSVMVGISSLLLAALGATKLTQYIPGAVKAGWKLGFALTVVGAQISGAFLNNGSDLKKLCSLPDVFGTPISGGAASMYRLGWIALHPFAWDLMPVALTGLTLFILLRCKSPIQKLLKLPGIEVVIACAVATAVAMFFAYDGAVVGTAPEAVDDGTSTSRWVRSYPWEMPWDELVVRLGGWPSAIVSAIAFACVDFLAILSVVPDAPSRELAGQGVGCIVSGMVGSAPIGGSLSRSMVAGMTGASSPLMGFVSGVATMTFAFPQVGAILAPTPKAVLAAVVLAAVLPGVVYPKDVLKLKGITAGVAWVTAIASCLTDPTKGFAIGCVFHALVQVASKRTKAKKDE